MPFFTSFPFFPARRRRDWSNLPDDVLRDVAGRLANATEVAHFRSVCTSWRASTAIYQEIDLKLVPFPTVDEDGEKSSLILIPRVIYEFSKPADEEEDYFLLKVEKLANGTVRALNPVIDQSIQGAAKYFAGSLDTREVQISEIHKYYTLRVSRRGNLDSYEKIVKKCVLANGYVNVSHYYVVIIDLNDNVWFIDTDGNEWVHLKYGLVESAGSDAEPVEFSQFDDVVYHGGAFYLVDKIYGCVVLFYPDAENTVMTITERFFATEQKRYFVLDNSELYLVQAGHNRHRYPETPSRITCFAIGKFGNDGKLIRGSRGSEDICMLLPSSIIFLGEDFSFTYSGEKLKILSRRRMFYKDPSEDAIPHTDETNEHFDVFSGQTCVLDDPLDSLPEFTRGPIIKFPELASMIWPPPTWLVEEKEKNGSSIWGRRSKWSVLVLGGVCLTIVMVRRLR